MLANTRIALLAALALTTTACAMEDSSGSDGGVDEQPPAPSGCGCGSADLSALSLMSLAALGLLRRRRS